MTEAAPVLTENTDDNGSLAKGRVPTERTDNPAGHTPIPDWDSYFATEDGRIWSATDWRGYGLRELKTDINRDFYPCVRLTVSNGARKRFRVHTLIAKTFLPPKPSDAHEVRHLDGDRSNPRRANLAWGTRAENAADRERHGHTSRGQTHSDAIKLGLENRHV